jgi:dTDP-glucose pyrophosphorylase
MIAILLAAGRSERVGVDKPTLELHGEMLVERHLRQLRMAGVRDSLVVCNRENESVIRERTGVRTVLQRGHSMSSAILTGMEETDAGAICLVCVNDIISDEDYRRILAFESAQEAIVIPTVRLEHSFMGGYLDIDPTSGAVRRIVEKPDGGCPPGQAANIMIHRVRGHHLVLQIEALLKGGTEYESAINDRIQHGTSITAVPIRWWVAIKTPDDIARAEADQ